MGKYVKEVVMSEGKWEMKCLEVGPHNQNQGFPCSATPKANSS